ncbi:hypothetical protein Misp01_35810 [Microtetraspora sp. NBRC 13810]|uniref:hypothetical protein n=1 Tax=Microtetraspora sp. NBRC 13810 TaxID=3030990 RepID=UPI0024A608B0|nr:hypothetical protein [Microtetraspora sp. NBRC 13810]GLW08451.1 hypothetical protein Misp01_35810 [Microtetraspora sp. NBRC 13810]
MLTVREGTPNLPWHDPREATRLLRYALHRQGFTHTYQSNGSGMSVLSVLPELTVWCRDGMFVWTTVDGRETTHPADDPVGAADLIARTYRRPEPSAEEVHSPTGSEHGRSA